MNLEDVLSKDAELWSEASPDQLFNEFFEQIRHEVWKYEEQLKANPKKFVKLFRLVLGRELLARQLAKATASGNTAEAETLRGGVENRDKFIVLLFA